MTRGADAYDLERDVYVVVVVVSGLNNAGGHVESDDRKVKARSSP